MISYTELIDKYYPAGTPLRDIYLRHCRSVAHLALDIAAKKHLAIPSSLIEAAAMTHDIGIYRCNAPSIECHGDEPYIRHGIIGGALLRLEGAPEEWARVAERHTGSGLTAEEISEQHLPLPAADYLPESQLERLICYADKFYSKSGNMELKPLSKVRASMARFGQASLDRFDALNREFSTEVTAAG